MNLRVVKLIFLSIITIFLLLYLYIWTSTLIINNNSYISLTQSIAKEDMTLKAGYTVKVKVVEIKKSIDYLSPIPPNESNKITKLNKLLLSLNGYRAVEVEYEPKVESLLGNLQLYVNPFTKQTIGAMPRQ